MISSYDAWWNGYVPISARLANALQIATRSGTAERFKIAFAFAEGLEIDTDSGSLGSQGLTLLFDLQDTLEEVALQGSPEEMRG